MLSRKKFCNFAAAVKGHQMPAWPMCAGINR